MRQLERLRENPRVLEDLVKEEREENAFYRARGVEIVSDTWERLAQRLAEEHGT